MRILWVKAGGLVPPDTGGKIRSYNILRELARKHSITFFSFYGAHDNDLHAELTHVFHRVERVPLRLPEPKTLGEMCEYGIRLFSREPYNISKYCRSEVRARLRLLLQQETFDVVLCDFLIAAGVIPWGVQVPKVIFTHNVEADIWRRSFEVARNPVWKALSWREWRAMEAAERRYLRLADHVFAVSQTDRDAFAHFIDPSRLSVIPTGVDTHYFAPSTEPEAAHSLVFTGSMDWLPNEDGMLFFLNSILPLIRKEIPDVSLDVVGRHPSSRLQEVASREANVRLTGWVEDIRPFLARAEICVVPLRIGGGTRLKIFEAMSMAKAVVSTTIGAEGLPVEPGKHLLLGDDPAGFARAVVDLVYDPERRRRISAAARTLVEKKYSWSHVGEIFEERLSHVANAAPRPR
jgi:sugar transferase (PEP-CTERM/EpsH1 system associated)